MPIYKTSKAEILEKCTLVFREKGYYHTTISGLAKACGIEKPHFYYYFSSKKHLMQEVLKYSDSLVEEYICTLAYDDTYPAKARLEKMLDRQLRYFLDFKGGCIFGNTILETANSEPDFKPFVHSTLEKWAKAFAYVFTSKFPLEEAEAAGYAIIQDFQGGAMLYQLTNESKYLQAAKTRAMKLFE